MAEIFEKGIDGITFTFKKVFYMPKNEYRYSASFEFEEQRYDLRFKRNDQGIWKLNNPSPDIPIDVYSMEKDFHRAIIQNIHSETND